MEFRVEFPWGREDVASREETDDPKCLQDNYRFVYLPEKSSHYEILNRIDVFCQKTSIHFKIL